MNNNKKKHALTSFAKSVLAELIRQLPMQIDVWRLEKKLDRLKAQNLELTSRLAAIESGMAHTLGDVPVRFQTDDENGTDDISTGLTLSDKNPKQNDPQKNPRKNAASDRRKSSCPFTTRTWGSSPGTRLQATT